MRSIRRPAVLAALLIAALATLVAACGGGGGGRRGRHRVRQGEGRDHRVGARRRGREAAGPREGLREGEPRRQGQRDADRDRAGAQQDPHLDRRQQDARHLLGRLDLDGRVRQDRRARRGAQLDPDGPVLPGRPRRRDDRRQGLRRAVARRDPRPLLPDRHRQEGRRHRAAQDWDELKTMAREDAVRGRRQVRHQPLLQQLAGVGAVRVAEGRRARRRRHSTRWTRPRRSRRPTSTSRSSTRSSRRRARSRASTSSPRSCAARTRCSSRARGTWRCSTRPAARASTRSTRS